MRQSGDVIKVQGIRSVTRACDVGIRPMRCLLQIIRRGVRTRRTVSAASLQSEIKFGGTEFHVVTPFSLWIKAERSYRQQVAAGRGIREIENMLGGEQALVGVSGIAGLIFVITEGKIRSHPPRQIGTNMRAGAARGIDEHWPMANKAELGSTSSEGIVSLRQSPDIVIANGLRVAISDPDLVVESLS